MYLPWTARLYTGYMSESRLKPVPDRRELELLMAEKVSQAHQELSSATPETHPQARIRLAEVLKVFNALVLDGIIPPGSFLE